ncbi:hypothetical protein ACFOMD_08365 [Sphingoaurantiacus capsulatus]|uniref:Cell envelope biogenesis protein TolA n=1 Tax=Sphingoaurantiacus capsulatus TaxID=1771310 RepID=A0ABV7XAV9_9SPHN
MIRVLPAALLLALAGCATPPPAAQPVLPIAAAKVRPGIPSQVVAQLTASAARQVKRCYRSPKLGRDARQITTKLRVYFAPDGQLTTLPVVVSQAGVTDANRAAAAAMAEAAMLAVIRCAPLDLPREHYNAGWDEFDLTFSLRTFA